MRSETAATIRSFPSHSNWALGTTRKRNGSAQIWLVALTEGGIAQEHIFGGPKDESGTGFGFRANGDLWFGGTTNSFGVGPDYWIALLDSTLDLQTLGAQVTRKVVTTNALASPLVFHANTVALTVAPTTVGVSVTSARVVRQVGD